MSVPSPSSSSVVGLPLGPEFRMEPYFAEEDHYWSTMDQEERQRKLLTRNVTVHVGETAFLECRIRNLGAKRVRLTFYLAKLYAILFKIHRYIYRV